MLLKKKKLESESLIALNHIKRLRTITDEILALKQEATHAEEQKNPKKAPICWIMETKLVIRTSIHKTIEGNLEVKPTNGVLLLFDCLTGKLTLRILPCISAWMISRRDIKDPSANTIANLFLSHCRHLEEDQYPTHLIFVRDLVTYFNDFLALSPHFPKPTLLASYPLLFPMDWLLHHDYFAQIVTEQILETEFNYNLYDSWQDKLTTKEALTRLSNLCRHLTAHPEEVLRFISADPSKGFWVEDELLWLKFDDERE